MTERLCETLVEGEPLPNRQMTEEQFESLEEKYLMILTYLKFSMANYVLAAPSSEMPNDVSTILQ